MTKEKEIEKPRGWANLQQQLKEVRDESFKQGVWAGQNSQKEEILKMIEEMRIPADCMYDCSAQNTSDFILIKELTQKIKGDEE